MEIKQCYSKQIIWRELNRTVCPQAVCHNIQNKIKIFTKLQWSKNIYMCYEKKYLHELYSY